MESSIFASKELPKGASMIDREIDLFDSIKSSYEPQIYCMRFIAGQGKNHLNHAAVFIKPSFEANYGYVYDSRFGLIRFDSKKEFISFWNTFCLIYQHETLKVQPIYKS